MEKYRKCSVEGCKKKPVFCFVIGKVYKTRWIYCEEHTELMIKQKAFRNKPKRLRKREIVKLKTGSF